MRYSQGGGREAITFWRPGFSTSLYAHAKHMYIRTSPGVCQNHPRCSSEPPPVKINRASLGTWLALARAGLKHGGSRAGCLFINLLNVGQFRSLSWHMMSHRAYVQTRTENQVSRVHSNAYGKSSVPPSSASVRPT